MVCVFIGGEPNVLAASFLEQLDEQFCFLDRNRSVLLAVKGPDW